jgi:hypothetical protein
VESWFAFLAGQHGQLPQLASHQPAAEDQQPPLLGIMVDQL